MDTTTTLLTDMVALFAPYTEEILADEMGDVVEAISEGIIADLDSATADWLFENWDAVLDQLHGE